MKSANQLKAAEEAAPPAEASALVQMIERAAANPQVDVEKMSRLLDMQERVMKHNAELAFNQAMTAAQCGMRQIAADADNPQTRSKYASYSTLDRTLRPIYTQHGFSLSFDTGDGAPEQYVRILCYVSHSSGHSRQYKADIPADGKGAKGGDVMTKTHAVGSAMSYGMRYLLKMIFNVAVGEDDDDGNGATEIVRINEQQRADLSSLIDEVKADKAKFLSYFKIKAIEQLSAAAYPDAVHMLEQKRKEQQREQSK